MLSKIYEILKKLNIQISYGYFNEKVKPPFICYISEGYTNFGADNKVYLKSENIRIELYSQNKNIDLEKKLENLLDENEIYYEKSEDIFIKEERLVQVNYYI